MANDITALLADGLNNLSFPTNIQSEGSSFELFPELPTELRLKIWNHALPTPTILRLTAQILVSDPSFGLYITFFATVDGGGLPKSFSSTRQRILSEPRSLTLLQACKESRELYLENFPVSLPFSWKGQGRLHISRNEVLHLSNFSDLGHNTMFQRALTGNYRLQNWWEEIEKLAIDITFLFVRGKDWKLIPPLLQKLPALKELKGVMWDGFRDLEDDGNAEGTRTIKDAMNAQLRNAEHELSCYMGEGDKKLVVPEIRLMI